MYIQFDFLDWTVHAFFERAAPPMFQQFTTLLNRVEPLELKKYVQKASFIWETQGNVWCFGCFEANDKQGF